MLASVETHTDLGIDEGLFSDNESAGVANELGQHRIRVIIAGLASGPHGQPCEPCRSLLAIAKLTTKPRNLHEVCPTANYFQRTVIPTSALLSARPACTKRAAAVASSPNADASTVHPV